MVVASAPPRTLGVESGARLRFGREPKGAAGRARAPRRRGYAQRKPLTPAGGASGGSGRPGASSGML
jgi:hypothetical protein